MNGRQLRNVKQRRSSLSSLYLPKAGHKFLFVKVTWASLVAQLVKNLPAVQETLVQSLEKGKVGSGCAIGCGQLWIFAINALEIVCRMIRELSI